MFMFIGLTGSLGAGKGVVSEFFEKKGFVYLSLSNELREVANRENIELTRKNLQDLGNRLREEKGSGILAELVSEKIIHKSYKDVIIDGVRNPGEVDVLRKLKGFFLIAVDAPQELRFRRLIERDREGQTKTWEEFLNEDNRDKGIGEEASTGQKVAATMEKSDFLLLNDNTLEDAQAKVENLYEEIEKRQPRPSWDEYFMLIKNAVAKRATCNRGRSGCVIAKEKQILVTGYVGSPLGLPHCDEIGHQMKSVKHEDGSVSQHCVRTTHAEQNAICQAARLGISINGATMYCNMTPCNVCAKMIINAGIKKVIADRKYHAGQESEALFKLAGVGFEVLKEEIVNYKNQ